MRDNTNALVKDFAASPPGEAGLTTEKFRQEVLAGLAQPQKTLPCKYLYDQRGAELFEAICELEEYYPTRTEMRILRQSLREIVTLAGPRCNLVELGSGSSTKTRLLLEHLEEPASYVPIDVAREQLLACAAQLARDFQGLTVLPVCADYTEEFELPAFLPDTGATLVFFPGSTLGNFEPGEAVEFLRRLAPVCGADGGLLLGLDLKKAPHVLHAAYNDSRGVTAAFNLNLLARANRELEAGFDLAQFRHYACYNEEAGRIEMHLVSRRRQWVPVAGRRFFFADGESILTEHSYKYSLPELGRLAAWAGFELVRCWSDERQWFGVCYLRAGRA